MSLTISYTNIRSLYSDANLNEYIEMQDCKFNDIQNEFTEIYDSDIIVITETWLDDLKMSEYPLDIEGYEYEYKNRQGLGGGLIIYIKNDYSYNRIHELESNQIENLCIKLYPNEKDSILINIYYRSPNTNVQTNDLITNSILESYQYTQNKFITSLIIIGDFNYPNINWETPFTNYFSETLAINGLYQIINEPTRYQNILDLVITDSPGFINNLTINPPIKNSDHNTILFQI